MDNKTCVVIVGATAVGKTSLALELAKHLNTSIISADSRQCYREMTIGVAKPSPSDLKAVFHYFINSHSITDTVNAAYFEQYALTAASAVFLHHDQVVMVGGTGMYISAFCQGLDHIPQIPPMIRQALNASYLERGIDWLQQEVATNDPAFYQATNEQANPHRLLRALEVKLVTGLSIMHYRLKALKPRTFSINKIGLEMPREILYKQINDRVDQMMEDGLLEEVQSLFDYKSRQSLQTVGYRELFSYLEGQYSLDEAINEIKKNTRHYAKRQMTWFRRDPDIRWYAPSDYKAILKEVMY